MATFPRRRRRSSRALIMTAALLSTLAQLASAMDPTGPRGTPPLARTSTDASQQRRPGFGGSSYPALRRYASVDSMVQGGATTYIYGHQSFIGSGTSPPLPVDELGDEDHAEPGSSTAFTVREVRGEVDSFSERFCWYTTAEQRYWESVHMTIEHVLPRNQRKSSAWNGGGMEATGDADDDHMDSTSTQFKVHRITRPFHPDLRPDSVHEENFRGNVQDPVASSITFLRHPDRNEVLNVRRLSKERDVVNNPMTEILTTGSTYKLEFCQRFHVGSRPGGETSGTSNGGNAVKSARLRWWERAPLQVWLREMHSELGDQNIGMLQPNRASRIWLLDTIHPHKLQSTVRPGQRVDGEPVDIHHQWSGDVDARPSVDKLIRIFERPQHVPAWLRDLMITPFTVHNYEVRDRRSRLMAWVRRAGYRCFESEVEIPYDAPTDRHYEFVVSGPDRDANGERIILGTRGPSSFWIEDEAGTIDDHDDFYDDDDENESGIADNAEEKAAMAAELADYASPLNSRVSPSGSHQTTLGALPGNSRLSRLHHGSSTLRRARSRASMLNPHSGSSVMLDSQSPGSCGINVPAEYRVGASRNVVIPELLSVVPDEYRVSTFKMPHDRTLPQFRDCNLFTFVEGGQLDCWEFPDSGKMKSMPKMSGDNINATWSQESMAMDHPFVSPHLYLDMRFPNRDSSKSQQAIKPTLINGETFVFDGKLTLANIGRLSDFNVVLRFALHTRHDIPTSGSTPSSASDLPIDTDHEFPMITMEFPLKDALDPQPITERLRCVGLNNLKFNAHVNYGTLSFSLRWDVELPQNFPRKLFLRTFARVESTRDRRIVTTINNYAHVRFKNPDGKLLPVGRSLDEDEDTLAADLQLGDDVPFTPIRNDPFSRAYIYVASTEKQLQLRWPFEGDITPKTGHVECPHHENVVRFDLYRLEEDDVAEDELPDDNGENRSDTRSDMIRASLNSRTSSGPISRTMTAGPVRAVKVRENIDVVFHNNRLMNDRRGVVMLAGLAQQALDGVVYESASEFEPDVSVAPGGVGDATAYSSSVLASRQSGIMQGGNQLADNDRATSGLEGGDVDDDFLYDFETHSNEVKLQSGVYFFRLQDEDALQQMLQPVDDSENGEPRGVESYRFYWDVPV